ncbi:FAD-binding domain-containing protein [Punctularia strigosozonata HHB-11173 SS5]|uniref:FAD-binding domain-containing protein n=1 Tax=Punctularia strigosozonata (strain HHB-11173) TaxID=741275 RepID=R7S3A0_PUNST|nr:FAD-binding domain-containing protein [Punctularia strigosozonata HHB-11173 SS5]EIN04698.1 FAD-binding domain-containing protein [Punctularia strigosozonata HHB-11173 SS5]
MRAVTLSLALSLVGLAAGSHQAPPRCRCTPKEPCWPSASEQAAFSASLSHPLLTVRPIGYPCHLPHYDAAECANVLANYQNGTWRANQPGASEYVNAEELGFGAQSCLPEAPLITPCDQGNVPVLGVNASTASDVQKTVNFAAHHNLKLIIKNSGCVYVSSLMGNGSLLLWTHNMQSIEFSESYVPLNAPRGTLGVPAVTIGAGVPWGKLYDAVSTQNHTIIGGFAAGGTVGAGGGWWQGAGHSALSPYYGLGVDNVLGFELVTANGTLIYVSPYVHQDLYWALRGGGGPSFGIVTSTTYKLHPEQTITASYFEAYTVTSDAFEKVFEVFHNAQGPLADAGWTGFYPWTPNYFAWTYINLNITDVDQAANSITPLINKIAQIPGVSVKTNQTVGYARFHDWYAQNFKNGSPNAIGYNYTAGDVVAVNGYTASRLLPTALFTDDPAHQTNLSAITSFCASLPLGGRGFLVGGGAVAQHPVSSAAVHPAWRSSLINLSVGVGYLDGTPPPLAQEAAETAQAYNDQLVSLTPASGTYLNEIGYWEGDFTGAFWGENYPRLVELKKAWDPTDLFMTVLAIGAENWDDTVTCRK